MNLSSSWTIQDFYSSEMIPPMWSSWILGELWDSQPPYAFSLLKSPLPLVFLHSLQLVDSIKDTCYFVT